jgi:iron only hydrogenase large subunit-like protein
VIRRIKTGKSDYDYVEIMACPSGCLNGGGQVKPKDLNMTPKDVIENLEMQYKNMDERQLLPRPEENKQIVQLL